MRLIAANRSDMAVFENFMEDVIIIAVQKFFSMNMCNLFGEEVDINGQFAECTTCRTIQLTAECEASYSARVMLKDATGTKKMTWIHDNEHMRSKKYITAKLLLTAGKFSAFLNDHQIGHIT